MKMGIYYCIHSVSYELNISMYIHIRISVYFRHIKEHFEGVAEFNESAMSPEELEFHYFK